MVLGAFVRFVLRGDGGLGGMKGGYEKGRKGEVWRSVLYTYTVARLAERADERGVEFKRRLTNTEIER